MSAIRTVAWIDPKLADVTKRQISAIVLDSVNTNSEEISDAEKESKPKCQRLSLDVGSAYKTNLKKR